MRLLSNWKDYLTSGRIRADLGAGVILDTADLDARYYQRAGTPVYADTDADTLRTPGIYTVSSDATASLAKHWPDDRAGTLEVMTWETGRTDKLLQRYTTWADEAIYTRSYYLTSWRPWQKYEPFRDTGLRGIVQTIPWTPSGGTVLLRRTGNDVHLNMYGVSFADFTTSYYLPAGFRPDYHRLFCANSLHAAGPRFIVYSTSGQILPLSVDLNRPVYVSMSWQTSDAFPTTYPGTPA